MDQQTDSLNIDNSNFFLPKEQYFQAQVPYDFIRRIQQLRVENKLVEANSIIKEWFL